MNHHIIKWMQVILLLFTAVTAKAESSDDAWASRFAAEPDPDAKIVYVNGMPKISLNGELLAPEFNQSGVDNDYRTRSVVKMGELGIKINQLTFRPAEYEVASGKYTFTVLEEKVRKLLETLPDARILILVRMEFPKWLAAHPKERVEYANGPVSKDGNDDLTDRVARPSAASKAYRAEVKRFLNQMGKFVRSKPWGKRVVAVRPSWGVYTEWHMYAFYQGPDIGPSMTSAFHRWKNGLYAKENPPTMAERTDKDDPFFLDRPKHQKAIDFFECQANEISDCLLEVAHTTKKAFPGRLVGMYYGYVMTTHAPEGANVMLDKVLSSPDVDFLSNPADYASESRLAGGAYYHRTIPSTFRRYGKLAMIEDDMRHYHIYDFVTLKGLCTRSEREAEMTTRRNWLNPYFDGCGIQMLDPEAGINIRPFNMDTPPVWRAISDTKRVLSYITGRPEISGNDVAVVVDWRERLRRSTAEAFAFELVYKRSMFGLYASGVPFDLMTLDDYLALPENSYRKVVFLNVFAPDGKMRDELQKRICAPDIKTAWLVSCPFSLPSATVYDISALPNGNDAWRQLLVNLGATPIAPVGQYIRRHGDFLMFHTGTAGTYKLDLPEGMANVRELYSGREYNASNLTLQTDGPDTFMFMATK